jgi:lipopolysaccharide/colanic/teichoic acid biosynthesis glycosyltransferase
MTLVAVGSGLGVLTYYSRRYFLVTKEVLDIVIAAIVLILTLPLMALCATIIRLSSRGPVLFKQVRVGQGGRLFTMYKFRTMRLDAEKHTGATWAMENDERIIPGCRWMRLCHADELPQLVHVLTGVMSFVGPRPERPEIINELERYYPNIRQRLVVKPGLTGLAQVRNGYDSSIEGVGRKLAYDLTYVEKLGWSQELRILGATLTKLIDRGAR